MHPPLRSQKTDRPFYSGLEADQKVIAAQGCYAMTATTALTAQNTLGVQDVHCTPSDFVRKQINAVCDDVGVDVIKTGRLDVIDSDFSADVKQEC